MSTRTESGAAMRRTSFAGTLVLVVGGAVSAAPPSLAMPITYTESATASGSLNGSMFSSALVTLTMTNNDTTNVTTTTGPVYHNVAPSTVTTTVTVSGVGSATFSDSIEVFDAQGPHTVGFADLTKGFDILDDNNSSFATYDLKSFIGPITGTSHISSGVSFTTTGGTFVLNTVGSSSTFSAVAVPAPVIGTGLPVFLAFAGIFFGTKLLVRGKRHRLLGS